MQHNLNFTLGLSEQSETLDQNKQHPHQTDLRNLQKVILQSFKYCQAKKSKNKYIRSKKIDEMKTYQKKLIAIVKKKSQEIISTLMNFSNDLIAEQEAACTSSTNQDEQTLTVLKEKLSQLKHADHSQENPNIIKQKIKRVTLECEEQLQKMEGNEGKKTDVEIDELINKMQRPFKKLCSYLSCLNKQIPDLSETSPCAMNRSESQQTRE